MMKQSRCRPVFHSTSHSTGVHGTGVMLFPYSKGTKTITHFPLIRPDEQKKADG